MIKNLKYTVIAMFALLAACTDNDYFTSGPTVPEGYERIEFTVVGSGMSEVVTRAVDIDGGGIQDLRLFCFDRYGLFITSTMAELPNDYQMGATSGTFSANIPQNTRCVHFIANQNMANYPEDMFHGKTEIEMLGLMESSSGKMIYWGRVKAPDTMNGGEFAVSFKDYLEGLSENADIQPTDASEAADVWMIRNHAFVLTQNTTANTKHFTTTGIAIYNHLAFGTIAPMVNGEFPTTWPGTEDYVTLPENRSKVSDVNGVQDETLMSDGTRLYGQFIFECENAQNDPISVILRGRNTSGSTAGQELYYRVMLQDENGEMIKIRRNHRYTINIKGSLNYGQTTFAAALDAPATNNIWISISDDIREVQNNEDKLTVHKTAYVIAAPTEASQEHYVYFNLEKVADGSLCDTPDVVWDGIQNVSEDDPIEDSNVEYNETGWDIDGENYNGRINMTLIYNANEVLEKREGTLIIKAGLLQRKVKVITIQEQEFNPAWVSSQVYGSVDVDDKESRAHATLMFTIPEHTPEELFPMKVLIATNKLDVRAASGMTLPIISRGQEGFGNLTYSSPDYDGGTEKEFEYKYVLEVTKPGVQRVYFENILSQTATNIEHVFIEAEHFTPIHKEVRFSTELLSINVAEMSYFYGTGNTEASKDEAIKFYLTPMRKGAPMNITMLLNENRGDNAESITPNSNGKHDEFLLFSQYLEAPDAATNSDITINEILTDHWTTNGRCHLFYTQNLNHDANGIEIKMQTSRARSAEPIRIASNESGLSYKDYLAGIANNTYGGKTYRSFVFELGNYRPFRFAAQVDFAGEGYQGTWNTGEVEEIVEEVEEEVTFPYASPNTKVNLALDITSFNSNPHMGSSEVGTTVSVDPFGEEFDIYIDAPMLKLDPNAEVVKMGKLYEHATISGRFVYKVGKDRETERTETASAGIGTTVKIADIATKKWTDAGKTSYEAYSPDQTNERKVLPFLTNNIVTAGNISVSADEEKVVFYEKHFKIVNSSKLGKIYYSDNGSDKTLIGEGEFVAVQRRYDHTRLASMTITAPDSNGNNYALRLRKEYTYGWYENLELVHTINGITYSTTMNLNDLCGEDGNEIVLIKK